MRMRATISLTAFFIVAVFINIALSQPVDSNKRVSIDMVWVNGVKLLNYESGITISDKDSIAIEYKLIAPDDADKSKPFYFRIKFSNGIDSSMRTTGVTSVSYRNLPERSYILTIGAFDLQRQWNAVETSLKITVDNEKAAMFVKIDSLRDELAKVDVKPEPIEETPIEAESKMPVELIVIILLVISVIILFVLYIKKPKIKAEQEIQTKEIIKKEVVGVAPEKHEAVLEENSNLRAEIAALRGQIDAVILRAQELSKQNNDLQENVHKLSKSKLELEELQKQKDELFAIIIHDIKNPASLIKSLVELLTSYDLTASEQQEIINDIAQTTIKIVNLSQEVSRIMALESSRLMINFEKANLNDVVNDVFTRNRIAAQNKSITFTSSLQHDLPDCLLDPNKVDEVVENLVSNAIKFTQNGGNVKIKTYVDNESVVCEVSDNGLGLSQDDLKHTFERGARLSAKPTGGENSSGLGLWIVKKLIDAHNGRVWVKSSLGKGSTFAFSIPINQSNN